MRKKEVALYTSAWIEMLQPYCRHFLRLVALYTSAWIEIIAFLNSTDEDTVALYTSAWIEISLYPCYQVRGTSSHSTRVRGLKSSKLRVIGIDDPVALYTSAWIEINSMPGISMLGLCRTLHECVD